MKLAAIEYLFKSCSISIQAEHDSFLPPAIIPDVANIQKSTNKLRNSEEGCFISNLEDTKNELALIYNSNLVELLTALASVEETPKEYFNLNYRKSEGKKTLGCRNEENPKIKKEGRNRNCFSSLI